MNFRNESILIKAPSESVSRHSNLAVEYYNVASSFEWSEPAATCHWNAATGDPAEAALRLNKIMVNWLRVRQGMTVLDIFAASERLPVSTAV